MAMSLRLLGDFELLTGEPATRVAVPNGRATALLKLLAVRRNRVVPLESVVAALWPDDPPDTARQTVSSLVSRLRGCIGPDLQRFEAGYRLDTGRWTVDLDEAVQLVETSRHRLDTGQPALADAAARRAVSLLGLELLAGTQPTDWLARARVEHEALIRRARHLVCRCADAVGDHDRAQGFAEAAIAADALDETAHRALMLAHYRSGEPALALRAYARLAEELAQQLGSSPAPATAELHLAILRGANPRPQRKEAAPAPRRCRRTLVGRDAILDQAEGMWHEVVAGNGRSLLIAGAPGSGRTAVLTEIAGHARATGGAVLAATCSTSTRQLPLHAIATALRSYCATARPELVRACATGFEDVMSQLIPELAESLRTTRPFGVQSALRRTRLVAAVVQFVTRLATQQPVLLAIDDISYADQLTLSALSALQRSTRSPVAIAATTESGRPVEGFGTPRTLCLGPLSRTAITELAQRAHVGQLAAVVHTLTAGHPRFVVEALRAAQQGSTLDELPEQLVAAALERIDRAGADVVDTLTRLAALEPRFTGVDAVQLLPPGGIAQVCRALAAGLLVTDGDHFAFESQLLRASLRLATPTPLRPVLGLGAAVPAVAGAA